jgi:hypothetical protein
MCFVVGVAEEEKNKLTLAILRYTYTLSAVSHATISKPVEMETISFGGKA